MSRRISSLVALAALLICALLLVQCSRRADEQAPSIQKVKLILDWRPGSEHAFLSLARTRKTLEKHGIELEVVAGEGSSRSAGQVDAGASEFGLCAGETALLAYAKGRQVRALAVFYPNTPATILSLAKAGIGKPEDLYGKRLGYIQGSSAYRNYEAFAAKINLNRSRIREIAVAGRAEELVRDDAPIDAMVHFSYQYPLQLRLRGTEVSEIPFRAFGIKVYGLALITSADVLANRPQLAEQMTRAVVEAYRYSLEHTDEALGAFLAEYKEQDQAYSKAKLEWVRNFVAASLGGIASAGRHDRDGWQATADYLFSTKQIDQPVERLESFFTTRFVP